MIGVLSIAGITGYTTAINKYKANEILNGASQRAMEISTQLQNGRTNLSLAEFGDDNTVGGATFSTEATRQGTDKFIISFTIAPSDEVLKQMKDISGTSSIVRAYTADGSLIYNNDLSTGESASDFDGDSTNCDTTKYTYCSGTGTCIAGTNQSSSCPENCAAAYTGSKTKSEAGANAKQIGNTGCYCTANANWNGTECKSTQRIFYKGVSGTWNALNSMSSESERCPEGGKWATISDLEDLGCSLTTEFCSDWPSDGSLEGWTATAKTATNWAYDVGYDGYINLDLRSGWSNGKALCVK